MRADYDRVLKQRNALLKTAGLARGSSRDAAMSTLDVWDDHLARVGAELLVGPARAGRRPARRYVGKAYARRSAPRREPAHDAAAGRTTASLEASALADGPTDARGRRCSTRSPSAGARTSSTAGITLVGPHRDDLAAHPRHPEPRLPAKGYASHGESWSLALALRLASYDLLRADGDDPILVLDDVFAELDAERRAALAELVAGAEQMLVTAAVPRTCRPSSRASATSWPTGR